MKKTNEILKLWEIILLLVEVASCDKDSSEGFTGPVSPRWEKSCRKPGKGVENSPFRLLAFAPSCQCCYRQDFAFLYCFSIFSFLPDERDGIFKYSMKTIKYLTKPVKYSIAIALFFPSFYL